MNTNISHIKSCYGCGVCAVICPQQIIKIALNKNGFYEPYIVEEGKCTDCGLCLSVCSYTDEQLSVEYASEIQGFAAWSNDENIRRLCSSGGIGFEIGKYLIKQGYKACGVQYNPGMNRADHFMASSTEEFVPSIGSKYIQSYTIDAFRQINRKDKYFITGTPCQIDSMRRYIRKMKIEENFVLMDFFCHGVPSMHVWKKYTKQAEKIVGKIIYASWRNKQTVWHDSWNMEVDGIPPDSPVDWHKSYNIFNRGVGGGKCFKSASSDGDIFYKFFLGDCCLGKACYDRCKYKKYNSSADIRIGDLWGPTYADNDKGVNGVLTFSKQGIDLLNSLKELSIVSLNSETIETVTEGQMTKSPQVSTLIRNLVAKDLQKGYSLKRIYYQDIFLYHLVIRVKRKLYRILS